MKHSLAAISLIVLFAGSSVSTASALVNYPQSWYSGACVNISRDLVLGQRGADVSKLQSFLVTQNFPGSGAWMVSGFFGNATQAAVRDFQQVQGLATTGSLDSATRAAISRVTCGGLVAYAPQTTTYPAYPAALPWNGTSQNYQYQNLVNLNITSLSQNTGAGGTQVTIYGTGFDTVGNVINFGSKSLTGIPSNGTSLSFIVPFYAYSGSVSITVSNSRGTSNALSFEVYSYGYNCSNSALPYGGINSYLNNNCRCGSVYAGSTYNALYPYLTSSSCGSNGSSGSVTAPTASYLNPNSGAVGTYVTIFGTGFSASNNAVHFGTGVIANLPSTDGRSLSFTVPTQLSGYGSQNTGLGNYKVSVTNALGYTTNILQFTVTSLGTDKEVVVTNVVGPVSLGAGTIGTWTVTLTNPNGSAVTVTPVWGDAATLLSPNSSAAQTTYAHGTVQLSFAHAYGSGGSYPVSFLVSAPDGTVTTPVQNVVVTGGNSQYGIPSISNLAPMSAQVGQQVTLYGTNFSSTNTVSFGTGAITNVYSNGTSIMFTVPSYVSPYCAPDMYCAQYVQEITPGIYNISVMNQSGTSNTVSFRVY